MRKLFLFFIITFAFILMPRVNAESSIYTQSPNGMYFSSSTGLSNLALSTANLNNLKHTFYGSSLPRSAYAVGWTFTTPKELVNTFSSVDFLINYGFINWLDPPFSVYILSNGGISACSLNPSIDYHNEYAVGITSVSCPNAYIGESFDVVIPWAEQSYQSSLFDSVFISAVTIKHDSYVYDSIQENTQTIKDTSQDIKDSIDKNTQTTIDSDKQIKDSVDKNTQTLIDNNQQLQDFLNQTFNSCRDSKNLINMTKQERRTINGINIDIDDGVITLNGTATNEVTFFYDEHKINLSKQTIYTISSNLTGNFTGIVGYYLYSYPNRSVLIDGGSIANNGRTKEILEDNVGVFGLYIAVGTVLNNVQLKPQLEKGSNSTSYEPFGKICKSKVDETNDRLEENKQAIKEQTEATNKQTDTIKDSNTDEASSSASGFFGNFKSDDFGLSDIITMPLTFIKGLSNNKCNNLRVPIPFVNQNVDLPCMTSIYEKYAGDFLTLYQTITTGFIAYWVCINIFSMVQGFKNPDSDNVEVLDL